LRVQVWGSRVDGLGLRVWGSGLRVWGSGFRVQGLSNLEREAEHVVENGEKREER